MASNLYFIYATNERVESSWQWPSVLCKGNVWLMGPFVGGHSYRPLNANRVICRSMGISDVSRWTNDALINAAHNLVCGENAAYHCNHSGQVLIIICGSVRNCGDMYIHTICISVSYWINAVECNFAILMKLNNIFQLFALLQNQ